MNILRFTGRRFHAQIEKICTPDPQANHAVEERVREIVQAVAARGDEALLEFTARFDRAKLSAEDQAITTAERLQASLLADAPLRAAVELASHNIVQFCRKSLRKNWSATNRQGGRVGEKFDPFDRVGIYVPGGTAPLVSTVLMTVLLAKEAGCAEIVVCTPPRPDGSVNPSLLFALNQAGATEIYRAGGAQAIAAMALGTATIRRVRKIFGPGNAYVVAAKRLLFGQVGIDLLPGPSELLVLADATANPRFIAADLLAQAEHGSGDERVWLVTDSPPLVRAVEREIKRQCQRLPRQGSIRRALATNGWLICVADLNAGIQLANRLAPEHCQVLTRQNAAVAKQLVTAGAIFLGPYSPTVLGDYVAGPSHVLPTNGAGHSLAGLTVDQFQRRSSVIEYSRGALKKSLSAVRKFGEVEGLDAHAQSAAIRFAAKRR